MVVVCAAAVVCRSPLKAVGTLSVRVPQLSTRDAHDLWRLLLPCRALERQEMEQIRSHEPLLERHSTVGSKLTRTHHQVPALAIRVLHCSNRSLTTTIQRLCAPCGCAQSLLGPRSVPALESQCHQRRKLRHLHCAQKPTETHSHLDVLDDREQLLRNALALSSAHVLDHLRLSEQRIGQLKSVSKSDTLIQSAMPTSPQRIQYYYHHSPCR